MGKIFVTYHQSCRPAVPDAPSAGISECFQLLRRNRFRLAPPVVKVMLLRVVFGHYLDERLSEFELAGGSEQPEIRAIGKIKRELACHAITARSRAHAIAGKWRENAELAVIEQTGLISPQGAGGDKLVLLVNGSHEFGPKFRQ